MSTVHTPRRARPCEHTSPFLSESANIAPSANEAVLSSVRRAPRDMAFAEVGGVRKSGGPLRRDVTVDDHEVSSACLPPPLSSLNYKLRRRRRRTNMGFILDLNH